MEIDLQKRLIITHQNIAGGSCLGHIFALHFQFKFILAGVFSMVVFCGSKVRVIAYCFGMRRSLRCWHGPIFTTESL